MYYNLKVDRMDIIFIIDALKQQIDNRMKAKQEVFSMDTLDKAEALFAWMEAEDKATEARIEYKRVVEHGKQPCEPF